MKHSRFLDRLMEFGSWRCDLGRMRGKGTVICAGLPYHSCRFQFNHATKTSTHQVDRRPVINI